MQIFTCQVAAPLGVERGERCAADRDRLDRLVRVGEIGTERDVARGERHTVGCDGLDRLVGELGTVRDTERGERYASDRDSLGRLVGELGSTHNAEHGERSAAGGDHLGRLVGEVGTVANAVTTSTRLALVILA